MGIDCDIDCRLEILEGEDGLHEYVVDVVDVVRDCDDCGDGEDVVVVVVL